MATTVQREKEEGGPTRKLPIEWVYDILSKFPASDLPYQVRIAKQRFDTCKRVLESAGLTPTTKNIARILFENREISNRWLVYSAIGNSQIQETQLEAFLKEFDSLPENNDNPFASKSEKGDLLGGPTSTDYATAYTLKTPFPGVTATVDIGDDSDTQRLHRFGGRWPVWNIILQINEEAFDQPIEKPRQKVVTGSSRS